MVEAGIPTTRTLPEAFLLAPVAIRADGIPAGVVPAPGPADFHLQSRVLAAAADSIPAVLSGLPGAGVVSSITVVFNSSSSYQSE